MALSRHLSLRRSANDLPEGRGTASDVVGLTLANTAKHRAAAPLSDLSERSLATSAWLPLAPIDT